MTAQEYANRYFSIRAFCVNGSDWQAEVTCRIMGRIVYRSRPQQTEHMARYNAERWVARQIKSGM